VSQPHYQSMLRGAIMNTPLQGWTAEADDSNAENGTATAEA